MSFVSLEFVVLFVTVLALLILLRPPLAKKLVVLAASCAFYAWWDWRFLFLLVFVTLMDYYISIYLVRSTGQGQRKLLLVLSILINLGFLGFFKYYNFFIDNLNLLLEPLGWNLGNLDIILPIGISFYTFETLSYVIDVYRGITKPAHSLLDYAIFITFFPRLVSGPIMRAAQFLPQLEHEIRVTMPNFLQGMQMFLQGLIKKLLIADNMALLVDAIYAQPGLYSSTSIWLGVLAYSLQILCDFSGYSDMAMGIGRIFGFQLPVNFRMPYTARSITEFWQRWHISLSTWLRDYLYIPLGGNRRGPGRTYVNLMLTMLLGGLWHGASWNFVLWGGLHGMYLAVERFLGLGTGGDSPWRGWRSWLQMVVIFFVATATWVPFRSPSVDATWTVLAKLAFLQPGGIDWLYPPALALIPAFVIGGWLYRSLEGRLARPALQLPVQLAVMALEALLVYLFSPLNVSPFIYFQF